MGGFFAELGHRLPELRSLLAEHLLALTLIPVTVAVAIAVPLSIAVRKTPALRSAAVGTSSIVQTIPSLAMLAFLLPFFGIGKVPAVIALTLYAILPILQNSLAAFNSLPADVLEATDGMGYSKFQKLTLVELPLALPVIFSGIRTAAVICVGVATLSTFIGAGGLGDFINRGLAMNNTPLLLIGAGAAAILALALDFILTVIGAAITPGRRPDSLSTRAIAAALITAALAAFIAIPFGTARDNPADPPSSPGGADVIHIGSKDFTEQILLGELLAQWIELKTDLRAERHFNLGGTLICHEALRDGGIDLYVEYSGTALLTVLKEQRDPDATPYDIVKTVGQLYTKRFGLEVLPPLGFENTYALTVRRGDADEHGWKTISDLVRDSAGLHGGFTAEFMERADGLPGLKNTYRMEFAEVSDLAPALMYSAAAGGEVDVIGAFSTDGRILEFDLVPLEDDLRFFPPYEAIPVAREDFLQRHPVLAEALRALAGRVDTAKMIQLNHAVDVAKRDPAEVVREFLQTLTSTENDNQHTKPKPMNKQRYRIQFPPAEAHSLDQDEVVFHVIEQGGNKIPIRFHDYDQIYLRPGLYEQLFYDRLKCTSPTKVGELLERSLNTVRKAVTELRVLDLGAGNGMMGEVLKNRHGVARLVGADIIPEARDAAFRDRPDVYDEYFVSDFTALPDDDREQLEEWSFNCLTSVAALGFGDIPPAAFFNAVQLVRTGGWVAFNIKETFLDRSDQSGFSRFIRELIFSEYLDVYHLERYRHRLSMEGTPLFYFALVGRLAAHIPEDFLSAIEGGGRDLP